MNRFPLARDLVLVGGGHTHILFLKKFAMNPIEGVRVTLVSPRGSATYSGMIQATLRGITIWTRISDKFEGPFVVSLAQTS